MKKKHQVISRLFFHIISCIVFLSSCLSKNEKENNITKPVVRIDTIYYDDGSIKAIEQYNDSNKLHGYSYEYYPNGVLKHKVNFWYGNECGDMYSFYENGNLSKYFALNLRNEPFFGLYMDSLGNITDEVGHIMYSGYIAYPQHEDYKLDTNYTLIFIHANPKNGFTFFIDSIIIDNEKIKNYEMDTIKSEVIVDVHFKQIGKHKMVLYSSLLNEDINYFKNNVLDIHLDVVR